MKLAEAVTIIREHAERSKGYRVHFERVEGKFLVSDYFPEFNEPLIETEERAWNLAEQFALATYERMVNVYVVDDRFCPVAGYATRKIANRPARLA